MEPLRAFSRRLAFIFSAALGLASCSHPLGTPAILPAAAPLSPSASAASPPQTLQIQINEVNADDPRTASALVSVTGSGRTQTVSLKLSSKSSACKAATVGIYCRTAITVRGNSLSWAVKLYDSSKKVTYDGSGPGDNSGSLTFIVTNQWTIANVSFANPQMGKASKTPLYVTPYYKLDNYTTGIAIGPLSFTKPIVLTNTDTTGATKLSPTSVTSPGQAIVLSYDGHSYVNPLIYAGKHNQGLSQTFLPVINAQEFRLPADRNAENRMGVGRILPDADGGVTVMADTAIERISADGHVTETKLPKYEFDIARGADKKVWTIIDTTHATQTALDRVNDDGSLTQVFLFPYYQFGPFVLGPDKNFWMPGPATGNTPVLARRVTPQGTLSDFLVPTEGWLYSVVSGTDGKLWYTGSSLSGSHPGNIVAVDTGGTSKIYKIPSNLQPCCNPQPSRPIFGPDGNLYFFVGLAYQSNETFLARLTPSGGKIFEFKSNLQIETPSSGIAAASGLGPDGAIWYSGQTFSCETMIGRTTLSGSVAFVQLPPGTKCADGPEPTAFAAGGGHTLWYTRGSSVGKIQL